MNNSQLIGETLQEEEIVDTTPLFREKATQLTEIVEALSNLSQSNYWQVLKKHEFDGDLQNLVGRLEKERDTLEIFRLQGEIKRAKKYDLIKLLAQRRQELETVKLKLKNI